jgi:two-component system, cell cycle sensor histidine kinase and response regulator CckA
MGTRGGEVILVVDDDDAVRTAVRDVLEREGYTVLEANDGSQALVICEGFGSAPDLVLSDIMMPEVNGGELLRELSEGGRKPRVLFMSGYADERIREAIGAGETRIMKKPFTIEELARTVREVLDE